MRFSIALLVFAGVLQLLPYRAGAIEATFLVMAGTALLFQSLILAVLKWPPLRSVKDAVSNTFARLPLGLGFSLLVVLGIGLLAAVVFLLRPFLPPEDSWLAVMLGVFWAAMSSIASNFRRNKKPITADSKTI